jgi:hypothetical protein
VDRDQVLAYTARLNNEWQATDKAISEAFLSRRTSSTSWEPLPFSLYDWRLDFYAWGAWYADIKDDWILGADEYNAAVGWDGRLKQWQSKIPEIMKPVPASPIPDNASTIPEDIQKAGSGVGSSLGPWLAGGIALAALLMYKSKS